MLRVLVIDGSTRGLRLVLSSLSTEGIQVIGAAKNERDALIRMAEQQPDVATLEVSTAPTDALQTLTMLRSQHASVPVVVLADAAVSDTDLRIAALTRGACEVVTKPTADDFDAAVASLRGRLVPVLRAAGAVQGERGRGSRREGTASVEQRLVKQPGHLPQHLPPREDGGHSAGDTVRIPFSVAVLVVAVSTGGPEALERFLAAFPAPPRVPIVIVQHMPTHFGPLLADRLGLATRMAVRLAEDGMRLVPGTVFLAPGDRHLLLEPVTGCSLALGDRVPINHCCPSADILFASAAEVFGARTLAVVLTGMGTDGLEGTRKLKDCGATVLAQDEASSVVWGMPGAVVKAGLADSVLDLDELARLLARELT